MNAATKTYVPKATDIKRGWRVVDAAGRPLGRVASEIAQILKGKDKVSYTPNLDTGDFVVVVNASKVVVTGAKKQEKNYYTHSMYPGGLRQVSFDSMLAKHPERIIEWAVWGMLPKQSLGRSLFRKLKVYAGATHPHGSQVSELAAPMKVGKPGKPRTPKKVIEKTVEAPVAVAAPAPATKVTRVSRASKSADAPKKRAPARRPAAKKAAKEGKE